MKKVLIIFAALLIGFQLSAQKTKAVKQAVSKVEPQVVVKPQVDRSKQPLPGPAPVIKIGDFQSFTLDNGLKVFVVENHKVPRVSFNLLLDIDPVYQGDETGFVEFAGELLRRGTISRSKDQIDEAVDMLGADLSTSPDGITARCLTRHHEQLFELMSDIIKNADFKAEELEKIRTQALSNLQAEKDEPDAIAGRISKKLMYGSLHPYGESMTEESAKKVTLDACKGYYNTFFKPNVAYLAIVGDINLDQAKQLVTKYLSDWKMGDVPKAVYPAPKAPAATAVSVVDRPSAVQSTLYVCYPVNLKPGSADDITAKVANTVLGGGSFRLFNNLREKHGWTYGAYSSLNPDKYSGSFIASTEVRNPVSDSAVTEILFEMNKMRKEPVPEEELTMVKNFMNGNFGRALENPATIARFAIQAARFNLPADYFSTYLTKLMAVTPVDIQMMAQKYFRPENAHILVVGNASEIAPKLKAFAKSGEITYYDTDGNIYDPNIKLTPAPDGITAETVINNYVNAVGGLKKIKKIKDLTMNASASMQGQTINFDTYIKSPDKSFMQIGSQGMVFAKQIYNAGKGVNVTPMSNETKPMEAAELASFKEQALVVGEAFYKELGYTCTLLGIEQQRNEDKWYKVLIEIPGTDPQTSYFDVNTGLKVKTEMKGSYTSFSDYREVNGVKFPYTMQSSMEGQAFTITVNNATANTKISDDLFKIE